MSIAQQAAAWSESPHHAEVLVVLGGRLLIDWLLTTAASDESIPEQGQAEQALLRLIQSGIDPSSLHPDLSTNIACLKKSLRHHRSGVSLNNVQWHASEASRQACIPQQVCLLTPARVS